MISNKKSFFLNKKILFSIILVFLSFTALPVLSQETGKVLKILNLEVSYPSIPGVQRPDQCPKEQFCLPIYISYWTTILITIGIVLALISLVVGSLQLMIGSANPETLQDGKDRVRKSIIGLILLLSSVIILRTINPTLVEPTLTPLSSAVGIYYYKSQDELLFAPMVAEDTSTIPNDYKQLYYKCNNPEKAPRVLLWQFKNPGLEGKNNLFTDVQTSYLPCNKPIKISFGSYKIEYEQPGVYFFLGSDCTGYMSSFKNSSGELEDIFKKKIKSLKIIGIYSVILHQPLDPYELGECSIPYINPNIDPNTNPYPKNKEEKEKLERELRKESSCFNLESNNFSSAEIFKGIYFYGLSAGDGIDFYSDVNGWDSGVQAGMFSLPDNVITPIHAGIYYQEKSDEIYFDYSNANPVNETIKSCKKLEEEEPGEEQEWEELQKYQSQRLQNQSQQPSEEKKTCPCVSIKDWNTPLSQNCGGSMRIKGNYVVTLYAKLSDNQRNKIFCQSFIKNVPNMSTSLQKMPDKIYSLTVLPLLTYILK